MVTYQYVCRESLCGGSFSQQQSIKDNPLVQCPYCHEPSLQRIIHSPVILDLTPKTMGGLSDKNTVGLSSQSRDEIWGQKDARYAESKKKLRELTEQNLPKGAKLPEAPKPEPNNPFSKLLDLPVNPNIVKMTPQEKAKYIMGDE